MEGSAAIGRVWFALAFSTVLLAHAALPASGLAQSTRLEGILDIHFGASRAEAQAQLLQHDGVTLDPVHSDRHTLICDGGTFARQPVGFWLLGFVDDQMHTAKAIIRPPEDRLLATYHELVAFFTAAYGEPDLRVAYFDAPYEAGDGFETYAVSFGKGHFATVWRFSDDDDENVISLSIDPDLYIPVIFQSGKLIEAALARHENAPASDS